MGDSGCGKTTLAERLATDTFDPGTMATIGVDFKMFVDTRRRSIRVWDTAGAERFRSVMSLYYRGADYCVLVFDASRRLGMRSVREWTTEVRKHAPKCHIFLVGNKIDRGQQACDMEGAAELARELGFVGVAFVSAKHMRAEEIIGMIQPLFDEEEETDPLGDGDDGDDKQRPLLGGLEMERSRRRTRYCCFG